MSNESDKNQTSYEGQKEARLLNPKSEKYCKKERQTSQKIGRQSGNRTSEKAMRKLTQVVNGKWQFVNNPPLVQRLSDLLSAEQKSQITRQDLENDWFAYMNSLPEERRLLLERFRATDAALRVGGVGSVGTRCSILMLEGDTEQDALILQQKEAGPSALSAYLP